VSNDLDAIPKPVFPSDDDFETQAYDDPQFDGGLRDDELADLKYDHQPTSKDVSVSKEVFFALLSALFDIHCQRVLELWLFLRD